MPNQQYSVEVQEDYLKKITGDKPMQALAEIIWNALDADASEVAVSFNHNELDTLSEVVVRDNGGSIARARAPEFFGRLGGSWKRPGAQTDAGRFLHGQEGRGRFKAFAIGDKAEWAVVYARDGKPWRYSIVMNASGIRYVTMTEETNAPGAAPGVTLTIFEPRKDFRAFDSDSGIQSLTEVFALYLADYQNITVRVAGQRIDPKAVIATRKALNLADIFADGVALPVRLKILEWNGVSQRALLLCNENMVVAGFRRWPLSWFEAGHSMRRRRPACAARMAVLVAITRSVCAKRAIRVSYLLLSSGAKNREIVPVALADNGLRWHVRGYDR